MTSLSSDQSVDPTRRRFFGMAAMGVAALQLGGLGTSARAATGGSFPPLRQIDVGPLSIGYVDMGPAHGAPVILLHGWPYDIHAFAEVAPLLVKAGHRVVIPYLRGYGSTLFRSADTTRNGQQAALALDVIGLMDALKIRKALLAGFDWGARTADIVAALWPERCTGLVSVSGYLIGSQKANAAPLPPKAELAWWYQFYFATERGRLGYEKNRHEFNKLIWQTASPQWHFDDATYERSAQSFDNPDHVAVVIHNYRWRLGIAQGEAQYDAYEQKLAVSPAIAIPTITMEGDANGAPHPDPAAYRSHFTGRYEHRLISGGIGHNLPQEAPAAFAAAVLAVARPA
jgi:pimeloyl-ACP methyl ester carboxylesterase